MKQNVVVNDRMQRGHAYYRTEPCGQNYPPEFRPQLTPKLHWTYESRKL